MITVKAHHEYIEYIDCTDKFSFPITMQYIQTESVNSNLQYFKCSLKPFILLFI